MKDGLAWHHQSALVVYGYEATKGDFAKVFGPQVLSGCAAAIDHSEPDLIELSLRQAGCTVLCNPRRPGAYTC